MLSNLKYRNRSYNNPKEEIVDSEKPTIKNEYYLIISQSNINI